MEGYAMGMAHAHQQALGHVRNVGALSVRVKQTEQEQLRIASRIRGLELTIALGSGGVVQRLRNLDGRMVAAEESIARNNTQLVLMEHRLSECENRTQSLFLQLIRQTISCAASGFTATADAVQRRLSMQPHTLLCVGAAWAAAEALRWRAAPRQLRTPQHGALRSAALSRLCLCARLSAFLLLARALARPRPRPPPRPALPA